MQDQNPGDSGLPPGVEYNEADIKRRLGDAVRLTLIFSVMYFVGALLATRELAHIAAIQILGMPLALYTGVLVFVVGLIVTIMCLNLDQKD